YRQSQRGALYTRYLAQLEGQGAVYPCFCTPLELELSRRAQLTAGQPPRYAGTCRDLPPEERARRAAQGLPATLRFRVPRGERARVPRARLPADRAPQSPVPARALDGAPWAPAALRDGARVRYRTPRARALALRRGAASGVAEGSRASPARGSRTRVARAAPARRA